MSFSELTIENLGPMGIDAPRFRDVVRGLSEVKRNFFLMQREIFAQTTADDPASPDNVVGVGVGADTHAEGIPSGRPAIRVLVKKKVPRDRLPESLIIPVRLPSGVPVRVIETGEISAQAFKSRHRPAPFGVSVGNGSVAETGTIACLVRDQRGHYLLSNNHVFANCNNCRIPADIVQPGLANSGTAHDLIAHLACFVPLDFWGGVNFVDAALASVDPSVVRRAVLRAMGQYDSLRAPEQAPAVGVAVQKSGSASSWTSGVVDDVGLSIKVYYQGIKQYAYFDNQFSIRPTRCAAFASSGDSGSLITTKPGNSPVGLLFAASHRGLGFANPIETVLGIFGIEIAY